MFKRFIIDDAGRIRANYIGIGFFCVVAAGLILVVPDSSEHTLSPRAWFHDSAVNEPAFRSAAAANENLIEHAENRQSVETRADLMAHLTLPESLAVGSKDDLLGLSPDELKILHARQQQDIEQALADLDAVVIVSAGDIDSAISLRELRALHEQQKRESNSVYDGTEIVIPASADGSPALSVSELWAMQDQQKQNIEAAYDADEIVIRGAEVGSGSLSKADLITLHTQQRAQLSKSGNSVQDLSAPLPKAGNPYLTVDELQKLHKNQTLK